VRFVLRAKASCTVSDPLLEVTELLGVAAFAVSCTVTLRVVNVPAEPPTDVPSEQLPLFVLVTHPNPAGKLFGVKV
jgi:hypothetical protein